MNKKLYLFISFYFLLIGGGKGQNLVPNGDFEIYDTCVTTIGQITRATGWFSVRPSPDYFNSCYNSTSFSSADVPHNYWGYQYAASGNGYVGFEAENQFYDYREYIGAQLTSPLQIGTRYYVSLKVSLSDVDYSCGINKLGVLFSTIHYSDTNMAPVCNCAQVYTNSIITDSANWTQINGSFVADSNYSFVNVGNFFTHLMTDTIQVIGNTCFAYYYADDICVSTDSLYSYNYSGANEGLNEITKENNIQVFPNPASNELEVMSDELGIKEVRIYNVLGEVVMSDELRVMSGTHTIDIHTLPKGIYFIEVQTISASLNEPIIRKKFVKE